MRKRRKKASAKEENRNIEEEKLAKRWRKWRGVTIPENNLKERKKWQRKNINNQHRRGVWRHGVSIEMAAESASK